MLNGAKIVVLGGLLSLISLSALINDVEGKFTPYELHIPEGFPDPVFPENNQLTQDRVDLGRMLFYDPVLSIDSTVSCASCHHQALAFSDNKSISPGVEGRLASRNAPTLANVVYNPTVLYDGHLTTLEMQVLVPIEEHVEMDFNIVEVAKRLNNNSTYVQMSLKAYERVPDAFVITRAIAAFERTFISGNSKYDQAEYQGKKVLSRSEKRGKKLFFEKLYCTQCHSGFNFTNYKTLNNGLYEVYADSGRMRVTKLEKDRAMFKVPTLRNIMLSAPYMHDGSLASIDEVIDHYESGGKNHKNKSEILQPFKLTPKQRKDLIAFLHTLTDLDFISNKRYSSPF